MLKNNDRGFSQRKAGRDTSNIDSDGTDSLTFDVDQFVDGVLTGAVLHNAVHHNDGVGAQAGGPIIRDTVQVSSASKPDAGQPQSEMFAATSGAAITGPAVVVAEGATVEIPGGDSQAVTFSGTTGTLKIDHSITYTGEITGLSGLDALDLVDINFGTNTQATFLGDHSGGTLTVTDGTNTAKITLEGDYLSSTWTLSSDGSGGTVVVDPVASGTWQTLKVGAGGFIRNFDIASDGTMVGRTDSYGAYLWNGSQWVQLVTASSMPAAFVASTQNTQATGQGVYEIQIADSNTQILYMLYDGYVFKSTNRGTTWTQTSFAQVNAYPNANSAQYGQKMAIDPNNPNIVYVGTPSNGLWVTKDGGSTWQQLSQLPATTEVDSSGVPTGFSGILFDPALGGVVNGVTQTIFAESNGNGVYMSSNGGVSWTLLTGGPTTVTNAAVSSTGVYYAVDGTNLWVYANGHWSEPDVGMAGQPIQAVAVNPANPNQIVVQGPGGPISVSYDGGATWSGLDWASNQVSSNDIPWLAAANSAAWGSFLDIGGLAFNPLVPGQLIASAGTGFWTATLPSSLGAYTPVVWNDQSAGIEQLVANEIIVPPGGKPILASWDRPFFYISDLNAYPSTYGPVNSVNIDAGWSVDYASSAPNFVVGLISNGVGVYSTDGGQTWSNFASEPSFPGQANGGTIAASSPQNVIIAPGNGVQPYYTLDGGATWHPVNLPGVTDWSGFEGPSYLDERSIVADRVLSNTFYLYYPGNGVYKSTNGGATWTLVYNGNDGFGSQFNGYITPFSWYNNELMSVPGEAGNLFFTGGWQGNSGGAAGPDTNEPFMRSTDGGATWTAVPNVLEVNCFGFGAAATAGGYPAIYIVGYVNNVYGIWQSIDNAQSWTQIGTYPNSSLDTIKTIAGDPNVFGEVYIGFAGSGYAVLTANSASNGPTVSSVAASGTGITSGSGDLGAGNVVTLTVNLSGAVTVAGGTPTLTLNDGGTATYTGGSGTGALTFSYTVGAGQNTSDLAVTAFNLNGSTVKDGSGNSANVAGAVTNPSGTLQIDTTAPTVSSVAASGTGITSGSGDLGAGSVVTLTVNLSEAVTVAGGTLTLTLNDGGTATYTGGSGTTALTFSYTVGAGQNTSDLTVTALNLNGATVTDGAGNSAALSGAVTNPSGTLQIDTTAPTVSSVAASGTGITSGSGDLGVGKVVTLTVNLSEAVTVAGGTPTLTLNDGGTATYTGGSGTGALTFSYTVAAGQNTSDLTVTAVNLNGATVKDGAGNSAVLTGAVTNPSGTLQIDGTAPTVLSVAASGTGITSGSGDLGVGSVVTLTVNLSEVVTVAGGTPTLTLNDGGTATYTGGSGTGALTFSYTVAAGQNTSDLTVTAVNLNGATVKDGAGNSAVLTGAVTNPSGTLQIDGTAPMVSSVAASGTGITSGSGDLGVGSVVTLTVNLSEAVTVAGGTPTLTLNDGGTATYTGGSGTNALIFSYTVGAGQNTSDLAVTAFNLNGSMVKDGAGNSATLTGAVTNPSGTLQIDGTPPTVSSVTASGTGITGGAGSVAAGYVVTLTVNLSEAVTVAGGTPTLTLNNGGTATYAGGSGTNALTFSYTVGASDSDVSALAITQVNLPTGTTIKDGAGNSANLTGVAATFANLSVDQPSAIEISGATSLVQAANNYYLDPMSGGTGPVLKYQRSAVYSGEFGAWTLIGAEAVSGGYDAAWKNSSTGQYIVWNVDSSGNYVKDLINGASATNAVLESYEITFNQDLNGDGAIGLAGTNIETSGATSLLQVGSNYFMVPAGGNSGPELMYQHSPVYSGEFGAWTTIGAEAVSGGYDVAWKNSSTGQYIIWNVDSSGNYVKDLINGASATNAVFESYETTFHQDLNGDGTIGLAGTNIETSGATSLLQVGSNYFMVPAGGNSGPELMYQRSPVYAGEFGAWAPVGAEAVSGGYDVAWKNSSTGQYIVWNVDGSGNYVKDLLNGASATNPVLESYEVTFHQDLNGDGTIGLAGTNIETSGATGLLQVGSNYFMVPVGVNGGPELMYQGAPVYSGEFGAWAPIGAEAVSGGYDVAWKNSSTGQYIVWNVDSSGNYVKDLINGVSASSAALASYEPLFQQDLNGDGVITILAGQTMELTGSFSGQIVFGGSTGTLIVDHSATFTGTIGGQLAIGDVIDFKDISAGGSASLAYSGNNSPGTLTVSDGVHTANVDLLGSYSLANFTASSDGHGGTSVVDPPLASQQTSSLDQQIALFSQYMASDFSSTSSSIDNSSMFGSDHLPMPPQLAVFTAPQQHAPI
ncbi:beta strand repeat-containing protein [Bradyrhizobium sp. HKCCYLS1011]|uniref:beta strand repeat-containing protein n=1 Tax=Bradyrhizobium sp. HKCCYLS1011 TaxID=3420733 RepID=UPI003EBD3260